jgi:uncharacterized protein DUF4255
MTLEETSKLWTAFQTQYRVSAAYRVAVVLIDSARRRTSALPVLRQGDDDRGPTAGPGLTPPFPALSAVELTGPESVAQLGAAVRLRGHHLAGDDVRIRFRTRLLQDPLELPPDPTPAPTDGLVTVTLPQDAAAGAAWVAGLYTVEVVVGRDVPAPDGGAGVVRITRTTNPLPLPVVPTVSLIDPKPPVRDAEGNLPLSITVTPLVRPGQQAALVFGSIEVPPVPPAPPPPPALPPPPAPTATLSFVVPEPATGSHPVRIRVDGVDSKLVVETPQGLLFDPAMQVVVP